MDQQWNVPSIIFLDVDGVVNTNPHIHQTKRMGLPTSSHYIQLPEDTLMRLKRIVMRTGAILIMSSSWRLGYCGSLPSKSYLNLNAQLAGYGMQLSGWTPRSSTGSRGQEIQNWLNAYMDLYGLTMCPPYIIIDDSIKDIVEYHRGHIIKTTLNQGLTDETTIIAINLLQKHRKAVEAV